MMIFTAAVKNKKSCSHGIDGTIILLLILHDEKIENVTTNQCVITINLVYYHREVYFLPNQYDVITSYTHVARSTRSVRISRWVFFFFRYITLFQRSRTTRLWTRGRRGLRRHTMAA